MNEDAIKLLYEDLQTDFDVGTIDDFTLYLNDDTKRERFFNEVILPRYDVESIDKFEERYGLKKKEDSVSPFADGLSERSEARKKFESSLKRLGAGISRIPTYIQELSITGAGLINPEFKDFYNSLSVEDRETFASSLGKATSAVSPTAGIVGFQDVGNANYKKLIDEAEQLEQTMEQFDTGIAEDIFSENFIRGGTRLINEAIGAIPSVLLAFTPGGIAVIGAGEAASKSRELQEQGKDLDLRTAINATGSGIAEGIFEGVTRGIGKSLYKSLAGKTKEQALIGIKKAIQGTLKGMGLEGSSEVGTLLSQQALDKWVTQDEDAFVNLFSKGIDTFLIGAAVGGTLGSLDVGIRKITQNKQGKILQKTVEKSKYENLVSAFTPTAKKPILEADQIDIIENPNSKLFLEGTLNKQVSRGEIDQNQANKILESYDKSVSLYYEVAGLNLSKNQKINAARLIEEKKAIENLIAGKDESLVKKERDRINQINTELEKISDESGGVTTIEEATKEDAVKALAEEGVLTPTDEQIFNKLDELTKIKEDAIQEPSTETIPVSEQPETSPTVREGDTQGAEIAGEITSEQIETTTQPAEEVETQVETQEGEIETYALPEDPKERVADFEIIDNRNKKEDFEIDEEGNGKWIIRNIKTGIILPLKRKADAQNELANIRRGKNMFDYGEGEPVLEEFRTQTEEVTQQFDSPFAYKTTPTQEERLIELTQKRGELTASEAAEELQILEPNIRRIFGQGAKTGKFERVGRGVYRITTPDNKSYGVIETANAIPTLKRLIKEKVKFDFIYLDPPYKSQGGKRNTGKFENFITKQEFAEVASLVGKLVRNKNTPVVFQYPVTKFTQEGSQRRKEEASFLKSLRDAGLDIAADFAPIELVKLDKQGKEKFHMRGRTLRENVFFLTKSGKIGDIPLDFTETEGIRELRYPQVDIRSKEFKRFGGRTRKNIDFMINLVESLTVPGAQVLDPFAGTGTTIQAAIATGRDAMGIEIEESTADIARKEIERTTPKQKTKPKPKPEPKKTLQKEATKKVKQTVPADPIEPAPKPALDKEVEKDIAKLSPHLNTVTDKVLKTNFDNFFIKIKNIFLRPLGRQKENIIQEQIRSTPVPKVDIMIGNKNSTLFYRTLYLPIVESYSTYKNEFDRTQKIITEAEDRLDAESKDDRNQAIINGYKIRLAQLALEHESNPDSDVTPSPVKLIDATIRESKRENVLTPLDAKELTNIRNQYLKDGEIKFQDVFDSLSDVQKEVFNTLQEQNSQLESFAKIAAARRGKNFKSIKDYSHRVVLAGTPKEKLDLLYEEAAQFSTQGGTIKEREPGGEPPVSFDPFQSARRGAQETFLDYYMSPKVTKVQDVARGLYNKYVDKSKGQRDTVKALQDSQRELLEITYLRSFLDSDTPQNLAQEITRNSYRLLLGSVPRFMAELGGNSLMLSKQPMNVINDAYTTYAPISMKVGNEANNKFLNTLINLGSTETDKLGGKLAADSKYNDVTGILNIDEKRRKLYNNTLNKMEYLANKPKQVYRAIAKSSDFLMGGADRVISRPIWISKFADEFSKNVKKYNKETVKLTVQDFNEISEGTSKYLDDKYKQARDEARFKSDQTSIELITSGNPLNVIIKNVRRPERDRSGLINYYRTINSFMANFTLNEYATARFAIGALQRSGEMSKAEAYRTLGGLVARMSSYVLLYKTLSNVIDSFLGAPEDEEEDVSNTLARQIVGSLSTLMFRQNLGNIPSLPINAGLEYINKNYLEVLRNGEPYNAYDNSIVYSLINLDQLGEKPISEMAAVIAAGPLGPLVRTLFRGAELAARVQTRKTEAARRRAQEELNNRITFELIGQLGFIPFFKDARRYLLKKRFADQSRAVKPPKTSLKELQQIDADLARELRELEKSFRDIEKAFED